MARKWASRGQKREAVAKLNRLVEVHGSASKVAGLLGFSPNTLGIWLSGARDPSAKSCAVIERLFAKLQVTVPVPPLVTRSVERVTPGVAALPLSGPREELVSARLTVTVPISDWNDVGRVFAALVKIVDPTTIRCRVESA